MPIVPMGQPVRVTPPGGFDYVTVDAARHRMYAAHGGAKSLLIVNTDTGAVVGLVRVGRMAGVAVNEATGHVYTGDGEDDAVSEVDPARLKEIRRVSVAGHVDAIQYDPQLNRIYADEDDGTRIFVIDSKTFKEIGTVALPGHKPEYLQIDPKTHDVYQNIASNDEIAVVDPHTLKVTRTIPTPQLHNDHPLQLDSPFGFLLDAGENRKLGVYGTAGKALWTISYPTGVDQCSLDPSRQWLACAGTNITLLKVRKNGPPQVLGSLKVARGLHTLTVDPSSGDIWAVWASRIPARAFVQRFQYRP